MSHASWILGAAMSAAMLSNAMAESTLAEREEAARVATMALLKQLSSALERELKASGREGAIRVCRELAPQLAGDLSRQNGWRVTRIGTRVRNPLLGTPDAWEQKVLASFEKRVQAGEHFTDMAFSEVVREPGGEYFRFAKAIGTRSACLNCHGGPDRIPASVQAVLKSEYPMDQAVGYEAGSLRGMVSIKQPMDRPLRLTD